MPVKFIVLTIIYAIDLLLLTPKYIKCKYDHTPLKQKLVWKELCVAVPFLTLISGAAVSISGGDDNRSVPMLVAAMFLCVIGDLVIEIKFGAGAICFALGHGIFIYSVSLLGYGINAASIAAFAVLAVVGTVLTIALLSRKYRIPLILYNVIVSTSFAVSIPLVMSGVPANVALGSGIICLVISDWLLARNKVFKPNYAWSLIAIIPYFAGQMLIALTPFVT